MVPYLVSGSIPEKYIRVQYICRRQADVKVSQVPIWILSVSVSQHIVMISEIDHTLYRVTIKEIDTFNVM